MSKFNRRGGFKTFEREEERKEQERSLGRNNIYGMFLREGEEDIPMRFLTDEPILGYFHSVPRGGGKGLDDVPCTGTGCPECALGENKRSYKGMWLVVDERPWERKLRKDGKETGEVEEVPHSVRILTRGSKDISVYNKKHEKFPLNEYTWEISRIGRDSSTSYSIERGEKEPLTPEETMEYLELLPKGLLNYVKERVEDCGGIEEIEDGEFMEILLDIVEFNSYKDNEEIIASLEATEAEYEARKNEDKPKAKKFGSKRTTESSSSSTGKKSFRSKAKASGIVEDEEEEEEVRRPRKLGAKKPAPAKKKSFKKPSR